MNIFRFNSNKLIGKESQSADRYRRAVLTSFFNGTARGVSVIAGLISVRLTIKYLGVERFGLWMTITSAVSILQFADLGIGNGLLNRIAEASGRDDREKVRVLVSSSIALLCIIAVFLIILFLLINNLIPWSRVFNARSPEAISEVGETTLALIVIFSINIILGVIVRVNLALQQGYINGIFQIFGNVLGLFALFVSIKLKAGLPVLVVMYMAGPIIGTTANGLYLFLYKCPWARPSFRLVNINISMDLLGLGVWFLLLQIVASFNNAIPNLVISHVLGLEHVAVFAVALKLASVSVIIQSVLLLPLWPAYAEARIRGDRPWLEAALKKSLMVCASVGLATSIIMVVFGTPIIQFWVGTNSLPPKGVLWGLGVWVLICSLHGPLAIFLNGMGKIRIQGLYGIGFSVFMLCLCIILTRYFNLVGSAWAYGTAYAFPSLIVASVLVIRILTGNNNKSLL